MITVRYSHRGVVRRMMLGSGRPTFDGRGCPRTSVVPRGCGAVGLQVFVVRLAAGGAGLFLVIAVSAVTGGCSTRCNFGSGRDGDAGRVPGGPVFLRGPNRPTAVHTGLFAKPQMSLVPGLGPAFGRRLVRIFGIRMDGAGWRGGWFPLGTVSGCCNRSGGVRRGPVVTVGETAGIGTAVSEETCPSQICRCRAARARRPC